MLNWLPGMYNKEFPDVIRSSSSFSVWKNVDSLNPHFCHAVRIAGRRISTCIIILKCVLSIDRCSKILIHLQIFLYLFMDFTILFWNMNQGSRIRRMSLLPSASGCKRCHPCLFQAAQPQGNGHWGVTVAWRRKRIYFSGAVKRNYKKAEENERRLWSCHEAAH